jgi:hypothetical protein
LKYGVFLRLKKTGNQGGMKWKSQYGQEDPLGWDFYWS